MPNPTSRELSQVRMLTAIAIVGAIREDITEIVPGLIFFHRVRNAANKRTGEEIDLYTLIHHPGRTNTGNVDRQFYCEKKLLEEMAELELEEELFDDLAKQVLDFVSNRKSRTSGAIKNDLASKFKISPEELKLAISDAVVKCEDNMPLIEFIYRFGDDDLLQKMAEILGREFEDLIRELEEEIQSSSQSDEEEVGGKILGSADSLNMQMKSPPAIRRIFEDPDGTIAGPPSTISRGDTKPRQSSPLARSSLGSRLSKSTGDIPSGVGQSQ